MDDETSVELSVITTLIDRNNKPAPWQTLYRGVQGICGPDNCPSAWQEVPAIIEELSDRETAAMMAVENAQRVDVDPIRIAEHLQVLTSKQPDGSKPLTQSEAATIYGISQSEVSNRVRLLRLPSSARDLVISGKMSAKQARQLVPLADWPDLVDVVCHDFLTDLEEAWTREDWDPGKPFDNCVHHAIRAATRPIDSEDKHHYPYNHELSGMWPRLFDLTEELRAELQVVAIPIGERPSKGAPRALVEVALNCDRYDELQSPLIKQQKASGKSTVKAAKPNGKDRRAELDKQRLDRRKVLDAETARRLTRVAIADAVDDEGGWLESAAAMAILARWERPLELLELATWRNNGEAGGKINGAADLLETIGELAAEDGDEVTWTESLAAEVVKLACVPRSRFADGRRTVRENWDYPPGDVMHDLPHDLIDLLAHWYDVNVQTGWDLATSAGTARDIVSQFFGYCRKSELVDLASELGVNLMSTKAREIEAELLAAHKRDSGLTLPKCLVPTRRRQK